MKTMIFALLLVFAGIQSAAALPIKICEAIFLEDKVILWCQTANDIVTDNILDDDQTTELLRYLDEGTKLELILKRSR